MSYGPSSVFYLFLFVMAITMKAWFRMIAATFSTQEMAQTVAGISLLALAIYTGTLNHSPVLT